MKATILLQNVFVLCLLTTAGGPLVLQAQQNPPPSRFNVKLGAIRAPTAPTEIPVVSSGSWLHEPNVTFTADGKEVFLSNATDNDHDLYFATRADPSQPWGAIQPVGTPVNTTFAEYTPWISADGLSLMWSDGWRFASNPRPGGPGGSDLWMSTRADRTSPWSEPVNLGPQVNSAAHESFPRLTADGLELFFCRDDGALAKIYVSRRASRQAPWEEAVPLPDYINLPFGNWLALPSPDGMTLMTGNIVASSGSPMDIFVSTRRDRNSPWNLPVGIGAKINASQWNQVLPGVWAPDGSALYFLHDDGNGYAVNGSVTKRVELLPVLEVTVKYSSLFAPVTLQSSPALGGLWAPVLQAAELENGENRVVLPAENGAEFFRLVR